MSVHIKLADVAPGVPGDVSRTDGLQIEAAFGKGDTDIISGRAMAFDTDGKLVYFIDDGKSFAGISTRSYPQGSGYPESTNTPKDRAFGLLRRGYCLVKCTNGTPVRGGKVYVYKTANGGHEVGDFSTVQDSTYTVELEGVQWGSSGVINSVGEILIL